MAKDIKIRWDNDLMQGDINFLDEDIEREEGLSTAVLMSLFTDRLANEDDPLDNVDDRRGWWADLTTGNLDDQIGSRLWLLDRSKVIPQTLVRAKQYVKEAIQWMVTDGVAAKIDIEAERQTADTGKEILAMSIKIYKIDGNVETIKFDDLWDAQFEEE